MQTHLPRVDLREEIHPQPWIQCKRSADQDREKQHRGDRPVDHPRQCVPMGFAQADEAPLEAAMNETERVKSAARLRR